MSERYYKFATAVSGWTGVWFFSLSAWFVATGYFLFFPARVFQSMRFYRALFPQRGRLYALRRAWRQYHMFTTVFVDRFRLRKDGALPYTSRGRHHLDEALKGKTGGIILMSHMGNWEAAAHILKGERRDMDLLLIMGIRDREGIERIQKESLAQSGVRVMAAGRADGSPLDILEPLRFLKEGGLVSLTGDVIWHENQRAVSVDFLGHTATLPETPHMLTLVSGAPVFVLFAFRRADGSYDFSVTPLEQATAASRSDRRAAIRRSAQGYADLIAEKLREYPDQWYHFGARISRWNDPRAVGGNRTKGCEKH
jgi:lauroyl/myristoyl acyltransferase